MRPIGWVLASSFYEEHDKTRMLAANLFPYYAPHTLDHLPLRPTRRRNNAYVGLGDIYTFVEYSRGNDDLVISVSEAIEDCASRPLLHAAIYYAYPKSVTC